MIARPASRMPAPGRTPGRTRAGFTLIELMGVILIIAILIAIALPAFNAVMRNARLTVARSEMTALNSSIAEFKTQFNMEPPSYIDFQLAGGDLKPQTKAVLRQMFPQIDFTAIAPALTAAGLMGQELKGSEALVFFLGGVRLYDTATSSLTKELVGFSKNPANPFAQPTPGQTNRFGPFFEFDIDRLVDTEQPTPDGLLEYVDKLPGQSKPLLYLSTARTGSYVKSDVENVSSTWTPYKKTDTTFYNPSSYQLISPGFDGEYGEGGVFSEKTPAKDQDVDNLTNFHGSQLGG